MSASHLTHLGSAWVHSIYLIVSGILVSSKGIFGDVQSHLL